MTTQQRSTVVFEAGDKARWGLGVRPQKVTGEVLSPGQELDVRGDRTFIRIWVLVFDCSSNGSNHIQVSSHTSQSLSVNHPASVSWGSTPATGFCTSLYPWWAEWGRLVLYPIPAQRLPSGLGYAVAGDSSLALSNKLQDGTVTLAFPSQLLTDPRLHQQLQPSVHFHRGVGRRVQHIL